MTGETYFGGVLILVVAFVGIWGGWQRDERRYLANAAQEAQERDILADACLQEDIDWSWTYHDSLFIPARRAE